MTWFPWFEPHSLVAQQHHAMVKLGIWTCYIVSCLKVLRQSAVHALCPPPDPTEGLLGLSCKPKVHIEGA